MNTRVCIDCEIEKPLLDFYVVRKTVRKECKKCTMKRNEERKNRDNGLLGEKLAYANIKEDLIVKQIGKTEGAIVYEVNKKFTAYEITGNHTFYLFESKSNNEKISKEDKKKLKKMIKNLKKDVTKP